MVSSVSGQSRSDFENFTAENIRGQKIPLSAASSMSNGKAPIRTPGVMRTSDLLLRNGQSLLPHEKAFSIQIGSRLFKLSGASINSDGKLVLLGTISCLSLKSLERPRISQIISKSSCDSLRAATDQQRRCSSTEIRIRSPIYAGIYKVHQSNGHTPDVSLMALQDTTSFQETTLTMLDYTPTHSFIAFNASYPSSSTLKSSSR